MDASREFRVEFNHADLFTYAYQVADQMQVNFDGNDLVYPEHIAKGFSKFFKINDFLSYQVADYTAVKRLIFDRTPTHERHIAITFRNFSFKKSEKNPDSKTEFVLHQNSLGSIQCKSTQHPELLVVEPGLEVKAIIVLMKEGWLENILHDSLSKDKFSRYLVSQDANLNLRKEYLSPEQNKLFTKLFSGNNCFLMQNLFYDSRVLNLLESFLKEVLKKEESDSLYLFASYDDIQALQKAEHFILENLMNPFPGVEVLSRISCMSRTKFINLFQKVYGVSSFEYSQKKRLSIAFDYLKSGKYSVNDTAQNIGYAGINNFAAAFKKEYGLLPGELLEKVRELEDA